MSGTETAPPSSAGATATVCEACRTENGPERRFCKRCGAWMIEAPPSRPVVRIPYAVRMRKWLFGRTPYTPGLGPAGWAVRLAYGMVPLVLVAALVQVRPDHWLMYHFGWWQITDADAAAPVNTWEVQRWAVDGIRNRGWMTAGAGSGTLVIRFPGETQIREISFETGYSSDDKSVRRPKKITMTWGDTDDPIPVDLHDTHRVQWKRVNEKASSVTIRMDEVYQPGATGKPVLIGEISFWRI
ncbi:hypothetical protein KIH74_04695 [Kineosporia sp. J2-2]|uniref:Zinc ribbon domain-containing protein n=1 Tax=Kineosporia corallincola TaxID=2835133 RepID=A0ABS5TDP1_9ACTN|nr:hypothetical protein [Kineosporia corallincola]MBT0768208.1 hypothetical protein [Kineosporia corallincola]